MIGNKINVPLLMLGV